MNYSAN